MSPSLPSLSPQGQGALHPSSWDDCESCLFSTLPQRLLISAVVPQSMTAP